MSAAHISSVENKEADEQSWISEDATEWQLNQILFKKIIVNLGKPKIDLFASCINKQTENVSWCSKPEAIAIKAFSMTWSDTYFNMFPPFSIISRILAKALRDQKKCSNCCTRLNIHYWYYQLMQMAEGSLMCIEKDIHCEECWD